MIVFDTEDDSKELREKGISGFKKRVTQIAALSDNGKRFHNLGNPCNFLKWCHEVEANPDIWAFNTQYDIGNLCNLPSLCRMDDFDVTFVKGRFITGRLEGMNFFDVHNLTGAGSSVATIGLAVDLPKFGHPYTPDELNKFSGDRQAEFLRFLKISRTAYNDLWKRTNAKKLIAKLVPGKFSDPVYVFRDCEIPLRWLRVVKSICEEYGIEKIPATLGSLAVKMFYALEGENWHEASDESQDALRGARVELFSGGGSGRIAYTDINSLYPWCMTQLFPVGMDKLDDLKGFGICKCTVEVPRNTIIAPLPWRNDEGQLLFPVGKFSGVWTIHELKNAIKFGTKISNVRWILGSLEGRPYYRDYVHQMFQNRLHANSPAESLFWKLLMNNLYGRLAISGEISRSLRLTEENKNKGVPYGRKVLANHQMPLPEFSNYLHAAHVLSYARLRLQDYLRRVPHQDLIYCDTDSIIFFCQDNPPFPISKELGEMKLEKWGRRAEPYQGKTYMFEDDEGKTDFKAKGVPKDKAQIFIETGSAVYDLPFKFRESIRFFDKNNSRKLSVWREVEKIMRTEYDRKRIKGKFYLPKYINAAE